MTRKQLPEDAFAFYVSLGPSRSYQAVGDHYGISKRSVTKAASRDDWASRLAAIEKAAQERADEKLGEEMADQRARHMKLLRAMASRAAKAIQEFPLASGMEGMRVAEMVIKLERVLAGEPSDRTEMTVEQVTKSEIDRLLKAKGEPEEAEDAEDDW